MTKPAVTVLCALLLLSTIPVLAIEFSSQKVAYSFRLSVKVAVDGDLKEGASVVRVAHQIPPRWIGKVRTLKTSVRGDAVFVDLGTRGHLIAILGLERAGRIVGLDGLVTGVFNVRLLDENAKLTPDHLVPPVGTRAGLSDPYLPVFVIFDDLSDPKTARVITRDDFARVFGNDVKLQGVSIEITDAPVTRGIEERLPWLRTNKGGYLSGKSVCTAADLPCLDGGRFTE